MGLALMLAGTGCGDSSSPRPEVAGASPPPRPLPFCAQPVDRVDTIEIAPGVDQTTLIMGSGALGVVLAPQSNGDVCQWAAFGRRLASHGYHVATFGPWRPPFATQVKNAVTALRRAGASTIVLVGASQGGTMALSVAAHLSPPPAGVISLSGETKAADGTNALSQVKLYEGPVLLLGSADDIYVSAGGTYSIATAHPGKETVVIFPGQAHGVEFLTGPESVRTVREIDRFLRENLPSGN
jgi:hypothetical protein